MRSKLRTLLIALLVVFMLCGFGLFMGCNSDDNGSGSNGGNGDTNDSNGDTGTTATLTIEEGTTIVGKPEGATPALIVRQDSKIMAEGTAADPILMTSDTQSGDGEWGGMVINGKAPINRGDGKSAAGEANTGTYGGDNPDDSSGVLNYVVVAHAGYKFSPQSELNGIAFQGVGNGTGIDHIQVHENSDDGVEFFGGTAQAKHVYLTANRDDSLDWTDGWQGKVQYVSIHKESDTDSDRGIEADNLEGSPDAEPRSMPTISNITINSGDVSDHAILWRRGTGCKLYNGIITGAFDAQIDIDTLQTFEQANSGNANKGNLSIQNTLLYADPGAGFKDMEDGDDQFAISDWFDTGDNNINGTDPQLDANNIAQAVSATKDSNLSTASAIGDDFFDDVTYMGAFDPETPAEDNWASGWTISVNDTSKKLMSNRSFSGSCPDEVGGLTVTDRGGGVCEINPGDMTEDATLDSDHKWVLTGYTFVGSE